MSSSSSSSSSSSRPIDDPHNPGGRVGDGGDGGGGGHHLNRRVHSKSSAIVASVASSRARRMESTIELRRSRRGLAVARRRRMGMTEVVVLGPSSMTAGGGMGYDIDPATTSSTTATTTSITDGTNPYHGNTRRLRDAMDAARSIVTLVRSCDDGGGGEGMSIDGREIWRHPINANLERLCALITPATDDDIIPATVASNSILRGNDNLGRDLAYALCRIISVELGLGAECASGGREYRCGLLAVVVVNQLAATESPPPMMDAGGEEYEGTMIGLDSSYRHTQPPSSPPPSSWCYALSGLCAPDALPRLLRPPDPTAPIDDDDDDDVNIRIAIMSDKVASAIGNLAGDSLTNRETLLSGNAHHILAWCVMSLTSFAMDRNIRRRANERYRSCEMDALRSTIWAMTNVIRGGKIVATTTNPSTTTTTTTFVYVSDDGMTRGGTMDRLLTPGDACSLLLGPPGTITPSVAFAPPPPPPPPPLPTVVPKMTSWDDVAAETCWLLSYLTRDPSVVEYLCPPNDDHCDVLSALVARLSYATDAACRRLGVAVATAARGGNDIVNVNDDEVRAIGCLVPICRALRNVAYADDDGRYGNSILSAGWGGVTIAETTGSSLAKLVVLGTLGAGSDANAIAAEAASTAGACLCRALLPPSHHAARAGLERLLPALRDAFVGELSTFELRREVAWAIWSAVRSPPPPEDTCDDVPFVPRTEFLVGIVHPSPRDVANALTTMLSTLDSDAMEVSLLLIDALLRRLGGDGVVGIGGWFGSGDMTTLFEEVGLVDALWRVCDADSEEGTIAEMAAAILDDFYERDDVLDDEYYPDASLRPSSSGGQYRFQIPPVNGIPSGGFDFGGATVDHNHPIPRGNQLPPSGRGRGRVLPSWMSLNDS